MKPPVLLGLVLALALAVWLGLRGERGAARLAPAPAGKCERVEPALADAAGEATAAPREMRSSAPAPRITTRSRRSGSPRVDAGDVVVGRCVDEHGRPLERVSVVPWDLSSSAHYTAEDGTFVGTYRPDTVAEGPGRITFSRPGFAQAERELPRGSRGRVDLGEVVLVPGGALAGRVLAADGSPAARARVEVAGWSGGERAVHELQADVEGTWRLAAVAFGTYELRARLSGAHEREPLVAVVSARSGDDEHVLVLGPFDADQLIRGVVTGADGRPRAGVKVKHRRVDHRAESDGLSDADGRFELHVGPGASWELHALAPESHELSPLVRAKGGDELELRLERLPRMELAVLGADGSPAEQFGFRVASARAGSWYGLGELPGPREDGVASVPVLPTPFELTVLELGHELAHVTGLDATCAGTRRVVRLERSNAR